MGCGGSVRNVPLLAMRKIREQEVALGRALSGERPGQDRHEPIHGGFGKNILFFTIPKTADTTCPDATPAARFVGAKRMGRPELPTREIYALRAARAVRALMEVRTIRHQLAFGSALSGERPGQDREKQDVFPEAPMDGFMAVPKTPDTTCPDATQSVRLQVS